MKKMLLIALTLFVSVIASACAAAEAANSNPAVVPGHQQSSKSAVVVQGRAASSQKGAKMNIIDDKSNPVIRIATSKGDMTFELYEDKCPNTVANIISLADAGFYKGMTFHRVIPSFMAQGGCHNSKEGAMGAPGTGGPGYRFADEFDKDLRHVGAGVLSMANSGPNTNGSQFFITFVDTPWLDGHHAVFGKILTGADVLKKIEKIGSGSGRTTEQVLFNIEVISRRNHPYQVKKL